MPARVRAHAHVCCRQLAAHVCTCSTHAWYVCITHAHTFACTQTHARTPCARAVKRYSPYSRLAVVRCYAHTYAHICTHTPRTRSEVVQPIFAPGGGAVRQGGVHGGVRSHAPHHGHSAAPGGGGGGARERWVARRVLRVKKASSSRHRPTPAQRALNASAPHAPRAHSRPHARRHPAGVPAACSAAGCCGGRSGGVSAGAAPPACGGGAERAAAGAGAVSGPALTQVLAAVHYDGLVARLRTARHGHVAAGLGVWCAAAPCGRTAKQPPRCSFRL